MAGRVVSTSWVIGSVLSLGVAGCAGRAAVTVRVLSYNIHHGEGMDGRVDLERIAGVIRSSEADLVALQEVDRGVARTGRVDEPGRLAELTGMEAVFERNITFQGGDYGNAILSRLPVLRCENHALPQSLPNEQRGLLEAVVAAGEGELVFFATHFDYHSDDGERLASAEMLGRLVREREGRPVIVAGDLNALPDSRVIERVGGFLSDTCPREDPANWTYPADAPARRIDYILHSHHPSTSVLSSRVLPESVASDHRPVLAEFQFDAHKHR